MLNDQLYKFYNLDFRILMTSHENDLYLHGVAVSRHVCAKANAIQTILTFFKRKIHSLRQPG